MSFWGEPGTSSLIQTRGTAPVKPPGFGFAQWLFKQLPALMNSPYPTYQGQLDPGLSPTLQDTIRRAQGYGASSAPEILSGVQGTLGRFMSPRQVNPWQALFGGGGANMTGSSGGNSSLASMFGGSNAPSMFGGAPNYFGVQPSQVTYGGRPASSNAWQMPSPVPPPMPSPQQAFSPPNEMQYTG